MNKHISYGRFQTEQGLQTSSNDPDRLIWYGVCGMWTDDWHKVNCVSVPHCPTCGGPGFQITAKEWFEGAEKYELNHPGYLDELNKNKESCPKLQLGTK